MIDQSKIAVTKSSVDRVLVLENERMFTGKGSMLSRSQRPYSGSVEVPEARLPPGGRIPKIWLTSGLKGLCLMSTSSLSILLARTRTGGIAVVKVASLRGDLPPCGVSN